MRKVVPIIVVLVVVFFVIRPGLFKKSPPATAPNPPTNGTQTNNPPVRPVPPTTTDDPRSTDPAVAAVVDEMLAAWEKVTAVYAVVETKMPEAAGHRGTTKGAGKYWLQKKDGKLLIHFDLRNEMRIKQTEGPLMITGENLLTTIDGVHLYSFINQPGHMEATKNRLDYGNVLQIGGPLLFRDLVANNKLTLLPEEMKGSHATKVIKAVPNDGSWETIHYFDKATGIRVDMTEVDAQGQTALQIKLSEINTNPTISEDQFKPVIPAGVTLEDKSHSP